MHECPECGQACDCDGDDVWDDSLDAYLNCQHVCDPEFDDDFEDDDFEDYREAAYPGDGASRAAELAVGVEAGEAGEREERAPRSPVTEDDSQGKSGSDK